MIKINSAQEQDERKTFEKVLKVGGIHFYVVSKSDFFKVNSPVLIEMQWQYLEPGIEFVCQQPGEVILIVMILF